VSRSIHAIGSFGTLARRVSWVPAAAVIALPFFTPGSPVSLVRVAVEQSQQLTITGSVDGLRPGVAADLTLTLDNRSDEPSTVHSVGVRVTGATSGCPLAALSARSWTGVLVVPAHGVATAVVPVTLTDSAGECAGTTWQLAYTSS
jgi:hypothetical protein